MEILFDYIQHAVQFVENPESHLTYFDKTIAHCAEVLGECSL